MSTAALCGLTAQYCRAQDAVRVALAVDVGEDRLNAVVAMPIADAHRVLTELAGAVADAEVDAAERERDSGAWWDAA